MKRILLIVLITTFISCDKLNSSEPSTTEADESINEKEQSTIERDYHIADMFLKFDSEKIGLISIIKDVPQEKANSVLRDYLAKTITSVETMKDSDYIVKVVDTIAEKNDLSKKLTASIIFSYQYEMITRDEIIDDYIDGN